MANDEPGRIFQAGIVDIGSHATRLEIFEVSRGNGYRVLESLSRPVDLGGDIFRRGVISPGNIALLCRVLSNFRRKMEEYSLPRWRVTATSALRGAFNRELVANRIRHDAGMEVEVLEPQQESRLHFLALREWAQTQNLDFTERTGLAFIVSSSSLVVIYFEHGVLKFSEDISLATANFLDEAGNLALQTESMNDILKPLDLRGRLVESVRLDPDRELTLVGMGADVRLLVHELAGDVAPGTPIRADDLRTLLERNDGLLRSRTLAPDTDEAERHLPVCATLVRFFLSEFRCAEFLAPEVTTRSALIADLIRKDRSTEDPFEPDIIAAAESIGRKYNFDGVHASHVVDSALALLTKLRSCYDFPPRAELLLRLSAMLHDIGRFIDTRSHHKHSRYLIENAQIPGIDDTERRILAAVARYHRRATPQPSHPEYMTLSAADKVTVLKLAAILRVADALDQTHEAEWRKPEVLLRDGICVIRQRRSEDTKLESIYLKRKSDLFSEVFGLALLVEEEPCLQ